MANGKKGRPDNFTPKTIEKLLEGISKGAPYTIACDYAGISYELFRQWRKKGEEGEPRFLDFFVALKEAEGATALRWLKVIDDAMENGQWQAAAWKLERRYFKYFSAQNAVIQLSEDINKLSDDMKKDRKDNKQKE